MCLGCGSGCCSVGCAAGDSLGYSVVDLDDHGAHDGFVDVEKSFKLGGEIGLSLEGNDGVVSFVFVIDGVLEATLAPLGNVYDLTVGVDEVYEFLHRGGGGVNTGADVRDEHAFVCVHFDFFFHIITSLWTWRPYLFGTARRRKHACSRINSLLYHSFFCLSSIFYKKQHGGKCRADIPPVTSGIADS